jgi:hypothetical protein
MQVLVAAQRPRNVATGFNPSSRIPRRPASRAAATETLWVAKSVAAARLCVLQAVLSAG